MAENNETATETKPEMSEDTETKEEYAYLDRGGFSSEKFKIELRGLPKYYGIAELKKLMNQKLGLKTSKIKRPKNGSHWLFACFQNEEERTKAIAAMDGYIWKGKTLKAEEAKPAPDPLVRKRKQEEDGGEQNKRKKENKTLAELTTPLFKMPYEEQLKLKEEELRKTLIKFDNDVYHLSKERRQHIEDNRKIYNGISFEVAPIKRSPVTEGYRNKCEFTVGIDDQTNLPTVGFRMGSYAEGTINVAPVHDLIHISNKMKEAVLEFQSFVRKSGLPPFSPGDYSGHWKCLTVRHSHANDDVMLIVSMHPQNLQPEELDKIKKDLVEHFSSETAVKCGIKSLYFELFAKRKSGENPPKPEHLMGATHIVDTILGKQFRISPEAFFQINTAAADILYQSAIELSRVDKEKDSVVVDVCCGTGTIGLCFAQHCSKVLGLELIREAINDAKANAKLNGIDNCEFFAGKAEDILPIVTERAPAGDVIAIVDPPRAGLHTRAVTQLRNLRKVQRIVYISCCPAAACKNWVDLARPRSKTLRGMPFAPVRAVPVDMFPHTAHVELAVLFERLPEPEQNVDTEMTEALNTTENPTNDADEKKIKTETSSEPFIKEELKNTRNLTNDADKKKIEKSSEPIKEETNHTESG